MKILIIGFDGGTERIFRQFDMPFMNGLLDDNAAPVLEEDLLNRGWVEILSGVHASECGAFYRKALCDGTMNWGDYKFKDLLSNDAITPLWKIAEDHGDRVGVMNIPTTFPAPRVNGFFVSSTGAGLFKLSGIPQDFCWPKSVAAELEEMGYRVDIRLTGDVRFSDAGDFVDQLSTMFEKRVQSYIALAEKFAIDMGFVACRCTNLLQYALMYEIERYFGMQAVERQCRTESRREWDALLPEFYERLDINLQKLVEAISPEHVILVSDHANVAYLNKVDLNYFLREAGFQKGKIKIQRSLRAAAKMLRSPSFRKALPSAGSFLCAVPEPQRSRAFSLSYINGIFINDRERFGGPVDPAEVESLSCRIIEKFNAHPVAMRHAMSAEIYRPLFEGAAWQDNMPDIRINYPDTMFFTDEACAFVRPNENYGPVYDISKIVPMYTGVKGRHPLCRFDNHIGSLVHAADPRDLRLVHRVVQRFYDGR